MILLLNSNNITASVNISIIIDNITDTSSLSASLAKYDITDLINVGSNISSSPGKVSINVLDPAKVAIMVATTPVFKYVDIKKVIELTSNKNKGMGGIDTKGQARKIY